MDLLKIQIPLEFIEKKLGQARWSDIQFGLENELLAPEAAMQLATKQLDKKQPGETLMELSLAESPNAAVPLVEELAIQETAQERAAAKERWLFIALAWLFEHRDEIDDPLQAVEVAYADFDYPEEVAPFVRYMPSDESSVGTGEAPETALLRKWERFLADTEERLRQS